MLEQPGDERPGVPAPSGQLLVGLGYLFLGWLALQTAIPPGFAAAAWPAAGVAVAGVLVYGYRAILPVIVAATLVNALSSGDPADPAHWGVGAIIGLGTATQLAVIRALFDRFVGERDPLLRVRHTWRFLALIGPLGCMVSPTLSLTGLFVTGQVTTPDLPMNWMTWWVGDAVGALLFGPVAMAWLGGRGWRGIVHLARHQLVLVAVLALVGGAHQFARIAEQRTVAHQFEHLVGPTATHLVAELEASSSQEVISAQALVDRAHSALPQAGLADIELIRLVGDPELALAEDPRLRPFTPRGLPVYVQPFTLAGRDLALRIVPHDPELVTTDGTPIATVLGLGLGISFLISFIVLITLARERLLQAEVGRRTSELAQARDRLEVSERRYRHLVGSAAAAIAVVDEAGRILEWNQEAERLLGLARAEVVDGSLAVLGLEVEASNRFQMALDETLAGTPVRDLELVHPTSEGDRTLSWNFSILPQRGESSRAVVCAAIDLTDRRVSEARSRALERRLAQSQQLEALGRLAGGIAHDFNNVLFGIGGFTEILQLDEGLTEQQLEQLEAIVLAVDRGRAVTSRIGQLSHASREEGDAADAAGVITEAVRFLRVSVPARIEVTMELAVDEADVPMSPGDLFQILLNLGNNAVQAMPEGGRMTFSLRRDPTQEGYRLRVADTGVGIPKAVRDRIFEPYFTTKNVGEGTGLGLALAYRIIAAAHGRIEVESEVGEGTTVELYLPAAREPVPAEPPRPHRNHVGGRGTILLVEDDALVLRAMSRLLRRVGYRVLTAGRPNEAEALFAADPQGVDLLITDYDLPERSGDALAQTLVAQHPGLPVILWTGHSRTLTDHLDVAQYRAVLHKPVDVTELLDGVEAALTPEGEGEQAG